MSDEWVLVAQFSLDDNLMAVDSRLNQLAIAHRFTESEGKQHLWVSGRYDPAYIKAILDDSAKTDGSKPSSLSSLVHIDASALITNPLTTVLLVLGAVGYALVYFKFYTVLDALIFSPFTRLFADDAYWRLITPAFIHFGIMHYVFNALWIWILGQRLEMFFRWKVYLLFFVFASVAANLTQYIATKQVMFGGLSGVVYAYLGCIYVLYKKYPIDNLLMPPGIFGFMLVWLALGFSGFIDNFIPGQVANWAHLGGLVAGFVFGLCYFKIPQAR